MTHEFELIELEEKLTESDGVKAAFFRHVRSEKL